ncbi:MAG: fimbrillin family protein [Prevotella sp.]|nr:fimbrillin family protein [Prevotella sp.]
MKKNIFFTFALAAALTACNNTDDFSADNNARQNTAQAIEFGVHVNRGATRAGNPGDIGDIATLQDASNGFGVFAYYSNNGQYSSNLLPNLMYNEKVTYDAVNGVWTYAPLKYWPNETGGSVSDDVDLVSFFAYAPYVEVSPSTGIVSDDKADDITQLTKNNAAGDPFIRYVVNTAGQQGVDLLYATPVTNQKKPTVDGSKVNFAFKHALAKLLVNVQADPAETADELNTGETKIYVRSITITGFAAKGGLNLNTPAASEPQWFDYDCVSDLSYGGLTFNDGRRDGKEGTADGVQSNEKYQNLNPDLIQNSTATSGVTATQANLFNNANGIYIIPSGGNEAVDVSIVYDVETKDDKLATLLSDGVTHGSSIENKISKTVFTASNGFKAGNIYTLNLKLGLRSVQFDASVGAWTTPGVSTDIALPAND